jgi:uncharacterized membrane protein YqjE
VTELARKASSLARKEVELAKSELRADLKTELSMASGLGIAGVCALLALALLLMALVLGLAEAGVWSGWAGALIVAAVVLAIGTVAGLVGWARRVRSPLQATRRTLEDDLRFAKERMP